MRRSKNEERITYELKKTHHMELESLKSKLQE
jgi:hypothetical protein